MMQYNFKLENFEGPLDLLLFLVRKDEIDIQNIPIVSITRQYMEYIELMKALNLDINDTHIMPQFSVVNKRPFCHSCESFNPGENRGRNPGALELTADIVF